MTVPPTRPRPVCLAWRAIQYLPQANAAHFRRGATRQSDAGDILSTPCLRVWRIAAGLGVELSIERRHAAGAFENRTHLACLSAESRSRMDLRQDRTGSLSGVGGLTGRA